MEPYQAIIERLGLERLEPEGGWFRRTWTADFKLTAAALPAVYGDQRLAGSAIYYLLSAADFSRIHRVPGVEIFHFYSGDPVELTRFLPAGGIQHDLMGPDVMAGQRPQVVVEAGVWQACRLRPGGEYALLGTTMAPGYDDRDFELARESDMGEWLNRDDTLVRGLLWDGA